MNKPIYEHDCEQCKFLGNYELGKDKYDLYYCEQGAVQPTVIARYGEGRLYMSGMAFAIQHLTSEDKQDSPLATALIRAYEKKMVNIRVLPS